MIKNFDFATYSCEARRLFPVLNKSRHTAKRKKLGFKVCLSLRGKSLYVLTIFSRSHRAFRSKATSCQPKHLRTRILYYPVLIFEAMLYVVCRFQKCKAISHDLARSTDLFLISYLGHIALKPSAYLGLPATDHLGHYHAQIFDSLAAAGRPLFHLGQADCILLTQCSKSLFQTCRLSEVALSFCKISAPPSHCTRRTYVQEDHHG